MLILPGRYDYGGGSFLGHGYGDMTFPQHLVSVGHRPQPIPIYLREGQNEPASNPIFETDGMGQMLHFASPPASPDLEHSAFMG